jgi:hypothetical protein
VAVPALNELHPDPQPRWLADAACRDVVSRAARLTGLQAHDEFAAPFADDEATAHTAVLLYRSSEAELADGS